MSYHTKAIAQNIMDLTCQVEMPPGQLYRHCKIKKWQSLIFLISLAHPETFITGSRTFAMLTC